MKSTTLRQRLFAITQSDLGIKYLLAFFLLLTAAIRLVCIQAYGNHPLESDALIYEGIASNLANGQGFTSHYPGPTAYEEPVYPAFVALTYKVFGHSYPAVYVLQTLLAVITGYLIYRIGIILIGSRFLSTLAVGMAAIYLPFIRSAMNVMTEVMYTALMALSVLLLLRALGRNRTMDFLISGICTGIAALCRSVILVLPTVLVVMMLLRLRQKDDRLVKGFMAFCLGMIIAVAPWTVRNYKALHTFIPVASKTSYVFWESSYGVGASIGYSGGQPPHVKRFFATHPTEVEEYRFFRDEAIKNIENDPAHYVGLAGVKFVRLWFGLGYPGPTFKSQYVQAFVHLVLLVLAGLSIRVVTNRSALSLILLMLGVITLTHMATMSTIRFSIPLMPFVFLLAVRGFAGFVPELAHAK